MDVPKPTALVCKTGYPKDEIELLKSRIIGNFSHSLQTDPLPKPLAKYRATTPKVYYLEGANIMANVNLFFEAFLDGFTGGGLFTRLRLPGAPTQVFDDDDDVEQAISPDHARKESDNGE